MTEYVATRWYRAPEVMLCELPQRHAGLVERLTRQPSRSTARLSTSGVWGVSLPRCVSRGLRMNYEAEDQSMARRYSLDEVSCQTYLGAQLT